ncbi:hypothetical protein DFA_09401 [Cavenderia fasciculata]|uniref:EGF-like domain-containing protein n=1 Tax=Cavenderia fasciculata TaxID=261658 RepID=F4Q7I8_CACFS|nr:uncharacterized protein DFA_09401 [Cavenderia fasciculata]EGG16370.1 hypothetical protein DFA_09401 [Cavenderia fasciculata]|eukprot:XP_004354754.1 hypothetical protein DFA_09401 [Cavenderia fasciculata]
MGSYTNYLSVYVVDSIIFIIQQYGLAAPQDQSVCSYPRFQCQPFNNGSVLHFTSIIILVSEYAFVGQPSTTLTSLAFPELTQLYVNIFNTTDTSINILGLLKDTPKLKTIYFGKDLGITTIPSGFPNQALEELSLLNCFISTIPNFFNGTNLLTIGIIQNTPPIEFTIDNSLYLPQMVRLQLVVDSITGPLTISKSSFPKLTQIEFSSINKNYTLNIDIPNLELLAATTTDLSVSYTTTFTNVSQMKDLKLDGYKASVTPTLEEFLSLEKLTMRYASLTEFPFSSFPPKLVEFTAMFSNFESIPVTPDFPPSLLSFDLTNNLLTGTIPWSRFEKTGMKVGLANNMGVTGDVPDSMCIADTLYVYNTGITSIPDCFWCYEYQGASFSSSLTKPPVLNCDITLDSQELITVNGVTNIIGNGLGWKYYNLPSYELQYNIPNKNLSLTYPGYINGAKQNVSISFKSGGQAFIFSLTEVGVEFVETTIQQESSGLAVFNFTLKVVNIDLIYSVNIDNNIQCDRIVIYPYNVLCKIDSKKLDARKKYNFTISNTYNSVTVESSFIQQYPLINAINDHTNDTTIVTNNSSFKLTGDFGSLTNVLVTFRNPLQGQPIQCQLDQIPTGNNLFCTLQTDLPSGMIDITVSVDGFNNTQSFEILSLKDQCTSDTRGCHGNGQCSNIGLCVCNTLGFYNNCSIPYPTTYSVYYNENKYKNITLYGDYGLNGQDGIIISINKINCLVEFASQSLINCTLVESPAFGLASLNITLFFNSTTTLGFYKLNFINFKNPSNPSTTTSSTTSSTPTTTTTTTSSTPTSPFDQCQELTFECFGHGNCNNNGQCICFDGYNQDDNCKTKYINTTLPVINSTKPIASFLIDNVDFNFEIVSIQELGMDDQILKELPTDSWISNVFSNDSLTIANYQLVIPNDTVLLADTNISAIISFSRDQRTIQFGPQQLLINPNSIKLSLDINNWQFSSNLATLRVVFKTIIQIDQTISYDCQQIPIEPVSYDELTSTLEYLRVVKENVQFNGRFLDYVLANGRPSYSKTEVLSISEMDSVALIGISLPQCQLCSLDPDFTPLLIDKSNDQGCEKNNNWKIIVGVVIGVFGAISIAIATTILIKKQRLLKAQKKSFNAKLQSLQQQ